MKAAVLHAFDETLTSKEFVNFEEVPDPKITRPTDVIVRIGGAGVCPGLFNALYLGSLKILI